MARFATQQSIKGAEFDKVIAFVDDQEGRTILNCRLKAGMGRPWPKKPDGGVRHKKPLR